MRLKGKTVTAALVLSLATSGAALVGTSPATAEESSTRTPIAAYSLVTSTTQSASGLIARVVLPSGGPCPKLAVTVESGSSSADVKRTMQRRSTGPNTQNAFGPFLVCEARIPVGAVAASVAGEVIPASIPRNIDKIALFGDSGCRILDGDEQNCNNPGGWPLARVASSITAEKADVVLFLGDYFYREQACPAAANELCGGSPAPLAGAPFTDSAWGWVADVFVPMAPLLGSAPLVSLRGNHELCTRGGNGFFLTMDPAFGTASACAPTGDGVAPAVYSPTWSVDLSIAGDRSLRLVSVDSANGSDGSIDTSIAALQTPLFQQANKLAQGSQEAWLLTHRPIASISSSLYLPMPPGSATNWTSVTNAYSSYGLLDRFDLMFSSHNHLAQAVTVPTLPPQIVLGNGGTQLDPPIGYAIPAYGPLNGGQGQVLAPGKEVPTATSLKTWLKFGYSVATPTKSGWRLVMKDASGDRFATCTTQARKLACR